LPLWDSGGASFSLKTNGLCGHKRVSAVTKQELDDAGDDQEGGYSQPPFGAVNTQPRS
jgi:hypothetical protein